LDAFAPAFWSLLLLLQKILFDIRVLEEELAFAPVTPD
jgi:hypothetical protein